MVSSVTVGTVVLLPPAELPAPTGQSDSTGSNSTAQQLAQRRELAAELMAYGVPVLVVPETPSPEPDIDLRTATAHWVAHNAMNLTAAQPVKPVLLVATGDAGSLLPAMGFAQKASRRPVAGYVVIDGALPKPGAADWPDAPVTFVATDPGRAADTVRQAELRGWTVETQDPGRVLRYLAQ